MRRAPFLIALLVVWSWVDAALAEKHVALVIGNSNYILGRLANPNNDADDVAAALKRVGFEVDERATGALGFSKSKPIQTSA